MSTYGRPRPGGKANKRMADLRVRINEELDALGDEQVKEIIDGILSTTRRARQRVWCPHCKKSNDIDIEVPAPERAVEGLVKLLDQAKGKPAETKQITVDITAHTITELETLTDAQLAALIASEPGEVVEAEAVEEAEWTALPPAAT